MRHSVTSLGFILDLTVEICALFNQISDFCDKFAGQPSFLVLLLFTALGLVSKCDFLRSYGPGN